MKPSAIAQAEAIVEAFNNNDLEGSLTHEIAECLDDFYRIGFAAAVTMLREPSEELVEVASRWMEVEGSTVAPSDAEDGQWQTWTEQARAALAAAADAMETKTPG